MKKMKMINGIEYLELPECAKIVGVAGGTIKRYVGLTRKKKMRFPFFQRVQRGTLLFRKDLISQWLNYQGRLPGVQE